MTVYTVAVRNPPPGASVWTLMLHPSEDEPPLFALTRAISDPITAFFPAPVPDFPLSTEAGLAHVVFDDAAQSEFMVPVVIGDSRGLTGPYYIVDGTARTWESVARGAMLYTPREEGLGPRMLLAGAAGAAGMLVTRGRSPMAALLPAGAVLLLPRRVAEAVPWPSDDIPVPVWLVPAPDEAYHADTDWAFSWTPVPGATWYELVVLIMQGQSTVRAYNIVTQITGLFLPASEVRAGVQIPIATGQAFALVWARIGGTIGRRAERAFLYSAL